MTWHSCKRKAEFCGLARVNSRPGIGASNLSSSRRTQAPGRSYCFRTHAYLLRRAAHPRADSAGSRARQATLTPASAERRRVELLDAWHHGELVQWFSFGYQSAAPAGRLIQNGPKRCDVRASHAGGSSAVRLCLRRSGLRYHQYANAYIPLQYAIEYIDDLYAPPYNRGRGKDHVDDRKNTCSDRRAHTART